MSYDHFGRHSEEAIFERVSNMIQRGTVGTVDDARMMQELDVRMKNGYRPRKIEHWHPYGFSTHPKAGAEVIGLSLGGDMDHMIVIGSGDRRYRVKVSPGEVALHDDRGQVVHLKQDGIHMKTTQRVVIDSPDINLGGVGGKPVAIEGSISNDGSALVSSLSTKVKAV